MTPTRPTAPAELCTRAGGSDARTAIHREEVRVAVIDSGWDRGYRELRVQKGVGLVDAADDFAQVRTDDDHDRIGHGTACARLILQAAPNARIIPIRVFGERLETSPVQLIAGLQCAREHDVALVTLSLATLRHDALAPLYAVCEALRSDGRIIVAAAFGDRHFGLPAAFDNVIGVEAGPVPGPSAYLYRPGNAIECVAFGAPPRSLSDPFASLWTQGNSYATARMVGILADWRRRDPEGGIDQAREWLLQHRCRRALPLWR